MANFYIEHSRRGLCRTVIVFLFTLFIINLSFADKISLSMKDFQDVYLGMTYEELKEKRPAIVGYSSVMDPKNVFREKKLDNDILKSAFYVFDGQSKLKWVAFGRDFFKPLQAQDGDVSKNAGKYVEYCINTWGKKYRKCVWDFVFNSKEYYIPCLIWEKEDKIIFAYFSFYEKKHDHIPPNYYRIYVARKDTRQGEVVPKNIISDPKIVDGVFLKYLPFINNKNEYYEVKPQKMEIIGKQPKIQIDNSVIDFGKIAEGVQIEQYLHALCYFSKIYYRIIYLNLGLFSDYFHFLGLNFIIFIFIVNKR